MLSNNTIRVLLIGIHFTKIYQNIHLITAQSSGGDLYIKLCNQLH